MLVMIANEEQDEERNEMGFQDCSNRRKQRSNAIYVPLHTFPPRIFSIKRNEGRKIRIVSSSQRNEGSPNKTESTACCLPIRFEPVICPTLPDNGLLNKTADMIKEGADCRGRKGRGLSRKNEQRKNLTLENKTASVGALHSAWNVKESLPEVKEKKELQ